MQDLKEKMNSLASKYVRLSKPQRSRAIEEIKSTLGGFVRQMSLKFRPDDLAKIDYRSIADMSLLKALDKYHTGLGNFDSYYGIWIRADVTRELISKIPNIRLPEYLAKKLYRILRDRKYIISDIDEKDIIMRHYNLTEGNYNNIQRYLEVTNNHHLLYEGVVEDPSESIGAQEDIRSALTVLYAPWEVKAICRTYGICGEPEYSKKELHDIYGSVDYTTLIKKIKKDPKLKNLLEDYNV